MKTAHLSLLLLCVLSACVSPCEMKEADTSIATHDDNLVESHSDRKKLIEEGRALIEKYECARCHEGIPDVARQPEDKQCVGCHQRILRGSFDAPQDTLHHWQQSLRSLNATPNLSNLDKRILRQWLISYLLEPHDLRPNLPASMPRLAISHDEAQKIASFLVRQDVAEKEQSGNAQLGKTLFAKNQCLSCHEFADNKWDQQRPADALLAPDLAVTRKRMTRLQAATWIRNPKAINPESHMPAFPLEDDSIANLVAYIFETPLAKKVQRPVAPRHAPPAHTVTYAEVEKRIFKKICWHCHSNELLARGDGGPGNTGGLGFEGKAIDFSSYESTLAGYRDKGKRRSLFWKDESGTPFVIRALLARHDEIAGKPHDDIRGMPLGFPPIPMEDIALLEAWIRDGKLP